MRTVNTCNSNVLVLANRQDRNVVAVADALRSGMLAQPVFQGRFFQALVGFSGALKRAGKPAAATAAYAMERIDSSIRSITRGLPRCWHTHRVMPHHAVVGVSS